MATAAIREAKVAPTKCRFWGNFNQAQVAPWPMGQLWLVKVAPNCPS